MIKNDLLKAIQTKVEGTTKKDIEDILDAYVETVFETLKADKNETIKLPGVGTFSVKHVNERTGTIMMGEKKGEKYTTPAHDEIAFKVIKSVRTIE